MKGLRKAYRGERGFTLVELLVVVVILGVLAAVATLAVTKFIGSGNVQAANTEMHNAKTAVAACMYDANKSVLATSGAWNGSTGKITATGDNGTVDAATFVNGAFKATYTFASDGTLTLGANGGLNGSWSGIVWDATTLQWKKG
jgi:type IV pilus assembly protein PilA